MMKKFYVLLAVAVMVCLSSMAFAADVTVGGSVQVRSRDFNDMLYNKNNMSANQVDTQERIMLDINAKAGDVKGKISIWNDFEDWGRLDSTQGNGFGNSTSTAVVTTATTTTATAAGHFGFREAWVSFNLPELPVNVTAGHQLLQLGNGWFLRQKHFGADAWVIANQMGPNTLAFVNIKVAEGNAAVASDDADAYAVLDVFKINEDITVGVDVSAVKVRPNTELQNFSANFNGKLGPVKLMAQADFQTGKVTGIGATEPKFKGNEIVVQGNVLLDPITINFLVARGSGNKVGYVAGTDNNKAFVNFLDIDPHYTFLYEYKLATAAGAVHTGFSNTTVISAGAMVAVTKSLNIGLDIYDLIATEKINNKLAVPEESDEVGIEIDGKVQWKLSDNLAWNWDLGYFKPGKAFKTAAGTTDAAMGIQGILAFKF
jgi:ethanolamine utilization microcompartment shell protein EutS